MKPLPGSRAILMEANAYGCRTLLFSNSLAGIEKRSILRRAAVDHCRSFSSMMSGANLVGEKERTEREVAEGIARRVAAEVIQNEFGSKPEPPDSMAQIGSLPDEIGLQPPTLQRSGARAWLL